MEEQDHMLSGFGIKNRGFEGAVIFNANLFRQVERLMLEKSRSGQSSNTTRNGM